MLLFLVATVGGVGMGTNDLTIAGYRRPESVVVKVALMDLAAGVVQILDIHKYTEFCQRLRGIR